jgi:ribonuclease G
VQKQIDDAFHRQVWLKCGGYIVIDETEALGRHRCEHRTQQRWSRRRENNSCKPISKRRTRSRASFDYGNIGGLIIADFIDMKSRRDQQAVFNLMKERLKRDKARTHVLPISQLGLMEMTRQRAQESLSDTIYEKLSLLRRARRGEDDDEHERGITQTLNTLCAGTRIPSTTFG